MGKIYHAACVFFFAIGVSGCLSTGSLRVETAPGWVLGGDCRILLAVTSPDPVLIQDQLEHRLLKAGYQVKPDIFVKSNDSYLASARKGKSAEKDFRLEYGYSTRRTFLVRRLVIDSFEAKMTGVDSRKKVMEMKFRGKMSPQRFVDEFMEKINSIGK